MDPNLQAYKEELSLYLDNRREDEKLDRFNQETRLRAQQAKKKFELEKQLKLLEEAKKIQISKRRFEYNKKQPKVQEAKLREKVVVLGSYNISEPQQTNSLTQNYDSRPKQPQQPTPQAKLESIRKTNQPDFSSWQEDPLTNDIGTMGIDDRHTIVFTDNRSLAHADERYRDIRGLMRRQK